MPAGEAPTVPKVTAYARRPPAAKHIATPSGSVWTPSRTTLRGTPSTLSLATSSKARGDLATTSKAKCPATHIATRPISQRQPQFDVHAPAFTNTPPSRTLRPPTTTINRHIESHRHSIPVPKSAPITNHAERVAKLLEEVAADFEKDLTSTPAPSTSLPSISEDKIFLEPAGKRRKKEPAVYNKTRGDKMTAIRIASDPELRRLAMQAYERDMRSDGDTSHYNFQTWAQVHAAWWSYESPTAIPVLPLTGPKIAAVGASLKAAGYRSTYNYATAAKDRHLESGYPWDEVLERAIKLFNASCSRGVGPARQSEPLPFALIAKMSWEVKPYVPKGPVNTLAVIVAFTFFLVRENEGAVARRSDVSINLTTKKIMWRLAASKTDPRALGAEREWGCLCGPACDACPFHVMKQHLDLLDEMFPSSRTDLDFPLFPTAGGDFVSEAAMCALVEAIAVRAGQPLHTKTGINRFGKHSWRSTGAVYLTGLGLELYRIQLLARWSSPVVMRYCRLAPLSSITDHVREHQAANNVSKLIAGIKNDVKSMKNQIASMETNTLKLIDIETKVSKLESDAEATNAPPQFVVNDETGCCHTILAMTGPPVDWITPCRFEFGRSRHTLLTEPVSGYKRLCHRCLYKLREERKQSAMICD